MLKKPSVGLLLAIILSFSSALAGAQAPEQPRAGVLEYREAANRAYFAKDYPGFRSAMLKLHELRPNNSEYMYQLVLAHALLNEKTPGYNIMLKMQQQGLSYDFTQVPDSENLRGTQVFDYLNNLMVEAGQPFGEAREEFTLGDDVVLPEAIAWDSGRQALLIGTVADGRLLAIERDGETRELLRADNENGLWSIFDIAVDQPNNRLWLSTAASRSFVNYSPADKGRSALFEFALDSLELLKRYPVPVDGRPHGLGNMALGPNGDLYVADGLLPVVYVKPAGEDRLRPLFASPNMVSLRGVDISDDGKNLYVADHEMGIVCIDLEAGKSTMLQVPPTMNVGGIDGLMYWNAHLLIIQNGISPQRVMRLQLDDTGGAVVNVSPLAVALADFDYPNFGTVVDEQLLFFANSHWGSPGDDRRPVKVLSLDIDSGKNIVKPDMQDFLEQAGQATKPGNEAGQHDGENGAGG